MRPFCTLKFLNMADRHSQEVLHVLHLVLGSLDDPALALNMLVHQRRLSCQQCESSSVFLYLFADEFHPLALRKACLNVNDFGLDVRRQLVDNHPAASVLLHHKLAQLVDFSAWRCELLGGADPEVVLHAMQVRDGLLCFGAEYPSAR